MKTNIQLLNDGKQYCVFDIESYNIFSINEFTYDVLRSYLKTLDIASTSEKFDITYTDLQSIIRQLGIKQIDTSAKRFQTKDSFKNISRITLHVANDCNLRCKYCYAHGGSYDKPRDLMTMDTAKRFIEYCTDNFESVQNIVFFGGEPFLNIPVIEYICKEFNALYCAGKISYLPNFGAITNGTIITDKVFSIIEKYFSFLTVSLDGPKEINDTNRVFENGMGSFEKIENFLCKVKEIQNLKITLESTFTRSHIDAGFNHQDIMNFVHENYNLTTTVVDELDLDQENLYGEKMLNPLESPWFIGFLKAIVSKQPETKCPILHSMFAITTDGQIYPCHMDVGSDMLPVSSIWENKDKVTHLLKHSSNYNLKNNPTCDECWAKNLCGGCSHSWFYNSETKSYSDIPQESKCKEVRRIAELTILKICDIRKTPEKWEELLNRFNIKANVVN